ncbi:hypothetical protein ACVIIV_005729 [Bradyrhizobium sp. USDA 4354]
MGVGGERTMLLLPVSGNPPFGAQESNLLGAFRAFTMK